jgi:hypothetical protein
MEVMPLPWSGGIDFHRAVAQSIAEAARVGLCPDAVGSCLSGFSGEKLVGCLQRFTRMAGSLGETCYVEIGVFQGLTLLSTALANPDVPCYGVDNFSLFNPGGENAHVVRSRMQALGIENATILDMDFEDALANFPDALGGRKVGVFFVDGAHDYRSQLVPLLKIRPHLAERAVVVVDDANYPHVRQATADFLAAAPDMRLLFEAYTPCHPANMDEDHKREALAGWWNGVHVLVSDPDGDLPDMQPPLEPRDLYFLSHDVFRHEFAECALDGLRYGEALLKGGEEEGNARRKLAQTLQAHRERHPGRFAFQNTYSATLPAWRINDGKAHET